MRIFSRFRVFDLFRVPATRVFTARHRGALLTADGKIFTTSDGQIFLVVKGDR